jgi:hypothetical protein
MYSTNILLTTPGLKSQAIHLVSWATERLEEEGRGIGIGGFNKTVAKNLMHVVWAIGAYKILKPQEYGMSLFSIYRLFISWKKNNALAIQTTGQPIPWRNQWEGYNLI